MVTSHQEKNTYTFIIYWVLCEKLGRKTLSRYCWLSNLKFIWFLDEKEKANFKRNINEKKKSILKSTLYFTLLSIGKIFLSTLRASESPIYSFNHTGLVRKTEKWKFKLQLIYLLWLFSICMHTFHKRSSLSIKNMSGHTHFQFLQGLERRENDQCVMILNLMWIPSHWWRVFDLKDFSIILSISLGNFSKCK